MISSATFRTVRSFRPAKPWVNCILRLQLLAALCAGAPAAPVHAQESPASCVDVNTAPAAQLERIIHIGPARAREIITLRSRQHFASVNELVRVDGIAAGRLRDIRSQGLACVSNVASPRRGVISTGANLPPEVNREDCVDINSASASELDKIVQIGLARAQQIILLRQQRKFASVRELIRVSGIGPARIDQIEAQGVACVRQTAK